MKTTTRLALVLGIAMSFFVAEIAIGFRTKSLALIADAFHYLNDIVAYAIAFVAAYLQDKGHNTVGFTYAFHRAELVGAFFNGVFLLALALSIFLQSLERFINIESVENPEQVMIIGCIGLCLNIVSVLVVHDHGGHSHSHGAPASEAPVVDPLADLHLREGVHAQHHHTLFPPTSTLQPNLGLVAVLVHLCGDAINSELFLRPCMINDLDAAGGTDVGVIVAGILIWKLNSPNRFYADPAVSLAISLIIFASAIPMTIKAGRILLEAAPVELDLDKVREDLLTLPDVISIHDMHVWILSQSVILASLHVCVPPGTSLEQWERTEQSLQHCFAAYGVNHVTISPELYHDSAAQTPLRGREHRRMQVITSGGPWVRGGRAAAEAAGHRQRIDERISLFWLYL
ncbi:Zinc/cadmium resistance protein [Mycena venus]|uniref:Zinc/cadmium resistance protein n=1 Tax=Mycena venus TaxID=2733690 RepID=A0A8H7D003_9AGAR|nr:Zinc/cadmium resistance protein [Mycena venus]